MEDLKEVILCQIVEYKLQVKRFEEEGELGESRNNYFKAEALIELCEHMRFESVLVDLERIKAILNI